MPKIGRNDSCPCGSGKKHKKCCGAGASPAPKRAPEHDLDGRLVDAMCEFARRRVDVGVLDFALDEYPFDAENDPMERQLFVPWMVYELEWEGRTIVDRFLEARRAKLATSEIAWLEAQQRAWLSIWEVTEIERGRGVRVTDLVTGEERFVEELRLSDVAVPRMAILARVVDFSGRSLFCGTHPASLPPDVAADAVRDVKRAFRKRTAAIPKDKLRDYETTLVLLDAWAEATELLQHRARVPRRLVNTDGEDLLLTSDHFALQPAARERVLAALGGIEGAQRDDAAGTKGETLFTFLRDGNAMHASWDNTVIARADVGPDAIRVDTNSRERADAMRARVEAACAGLAVTHRARTHADPMSAAGAGERAPAAATSPVIDTPEVREVLRELKAQHYATWLDAALPALDGRTPREAATTASGRRAVDLLLKTMEMQEAAQPEDSRFDFAAMRRSLGLDRPRRAHARHEQTKLFD